MNYWIEVRAAEDRRLLGRVSCPMPPHELPDHVQFALKEAPDDLEFRTVTLRVVEFREGWSSWRGFSVSAAQWDQIKDKVRV